MIGSSSLSFYSKRKEGRHFIWTIYVNLFAYTHYTYLPVLNVNDTILTIYCFVSELIWRTRL